MMSNFGGKASKFEKDFNNNFKDINNELKRIQKDIYTVVLNAGRSVEVSASYWLGVRRKVDVLYQEMVNTFAVYASTEIPLAYRKSVTAIYSKINKSSTLQTVFISPQEILNTKKSIDAMRLLAVNATRDFSRAADRGRKKIHRWTRLTRQTLLTDSFIDAAISNIFTLTGDLTAAANALGSELWKKASVDATGKRYVQTRSAKGVRNFEPNYYAEMVSRVKYHEAQAEATIQTATIYGTSLVLVSSHNTTTEICQEHEGKIYSIEGKDPRFPVLVDRPPYHPNCLHLLFPMFESAMKLDGTMEDWQKFSRGETSRPPAPAGFVPVGERGA